MRFLILIFILSPFIVLYGTSWSTATQISNVSTVFFNVYTASGPITGDLVATWARQDSSHSPYFAVYSGGVWSSAAAIPLGGSSGSAYDVYITLGPDSETLIASWSDLNTHAPYYSIYMNGSWSQALPISNSPNGTFLNVFIASRPETGQLMATWVDRSSAIPYFSIYTAGSWSAASPIPKGSSSGANIDVAIASGSVSGEFMATWADSISYAPYYAIYMNGNWQVALPIPQGSSTGAYNNVLVSSGPNAMEWTATWANQSLRTPYYAIYSNGSWATATIIAQNGSSGARVDVSIAAGSSNGQLIATWADSFSYAPYYAIYSNGSWATAKIIPQNGSSGSLYNISIGIGPFGKNWVAAWGDASSFFPYYTIFAPLPPTNGTGHQTADRFPFSVEWFNSIKWTASISEIVGYNIKRGGATIANNVTSTDYTDFDRPQNAIEVYSVIGVDAEGVESSPLEIVVNPL